MLTQSDLQKIKDLLEERELTLLQKELKSIRKDLKKFITKEDAKAFLTKEDAKVFATKDDLNQVVEAIIEFIGNLGNELKQHENTINNHETRIKKLEIKNPLAL